MNMDMDVMRQFVEACRARDEARAALKAAEARVRELEPQVVDSLLQAGVDSVKLADGTTVYLRQQLWARPVDKARACDALERAGVPELVERTVNTHRLSAWVRELVNEANLAPGEDPAQALPEDLRNVVVVSEDIKAVVRRS